MTQTVIDELKKSQILELLEQGKRVDGRALDEPRKLTIEPNAIPMDQLELDWEKLKLYVVLKFNLIDLFQTWVTKEFLFALQNFCLYLILVLKLVLQVQML
jgi:hypothetical protein